MARTSHVDFLVSIGIALVMMRIHLSIKRRRRTSSVHPITASISVTFSCIIGIMLMLLVLDISFEIVSFFRVHTSFCIAIMAMVVM